MTDSNRTGQSGGFVSSLSVPIGLVAEYRQHRKEIKENRSRSNSNVSQSSTVQEPNTSEYSALPLAQMPSADELEQLENADTVSVQDDETLWELDEAILAARKDQYPSEELVELPTNESVETLVREVMGAARGLKKSSDVRTGKLPFPVVIPQRRPRNKSRGFLRAYAPALNACGITQDVFLEFLKNFHKSSQASPFFEVALIGSNIAMQIPNHIVNPIAIMVSATATVGSEVQRRQRTNKFLDRMNQELFQPAGLYAMIVKYKTDAEMEQTMPAEQNLYNMISLGRVDLTTNQAIAKYGDQPSEDVKGMSARMQRLRVASGVTRGAVELPAACPLIFPDLVNLNPEGQETLKAKFKDASKFVSGYLDRRAQRSYAMTNPDTSLTVPDAQLRYRSKVSDPTHPMYASGTFMAFISGGAITPSAKKNAVQREKALHEDMLLVLEGREPKSGRSNERYGAGYYEELFYRTDQYREIALEEDIKSISEGSEPKSKQHQRYGEGYYQELYDRTREVRELALQQDILAVSRGEEPKSSQDSIYGKGYYDELRGRTSWNQKGAVADQARSTSIGLYSSVEQAPPLPKRTYEQQYAESNHPLEAYQMQSNDEKLKQINQSGEWGPSEGKERKKSGNPYLKAVKRVVQEDVLYLMIANMPSQAELDQAKLELERMKVSQKQK